MAWPANQSTDAVWKRAGGRRHFNAVRRLQRLRRRLNVARMLFEKRAPVALSQKRILPWGIQKEIAARLGVSEGTVSRDVKAITREHLYPGLPAAKAGALAQEDRMAIVRAVAAISKRKDLPPSQAIEAGQILVDVRALENVSNVLTRRQWRERTQAICQRTYRLFVATLTESETREAFRSLAADAKRQERRWVLLRGGAGSGNRTAHLQSERHL